MKQERFAIVRARRFELRAVVVVHLGQPLGAELECGHVLRSKRSRAGAARRRCWLCPKKEPSRVRA